MNKSYKFLLTDTLFILLLVVLLFSVFFINISIQLIEILFRNNVNYDEYDFMFKGRSNDFDLDNENEKNKTDKCDSEIRRYIGL